MHVDLNTNQNSCLPPGIEQRYGSDYDNSSGHRISTASGMRSDSVVSALQSRWILSMVALHDSTEDQE
jgi:hypothetical protein